MIDSFCHRALLNEILFRFMKQTNGMACQNFYTACNFRRFTEKKTQYTSPLLQSSCMYFIIIVQQPNTFHFWGLGVLTWICWKPLVQLSTFTSSSPKLHFLYTVLFLHPSVHQSLLIQIMLWIYFSCPY